MKPASGQIWCYAKQKNDISYHFILDYFLLEKNVWISSNGNYIGPDYLDNDRYIYIGRHRQLTRLEIIINESKS